MSDNQSLPAMADTAPVAPTQRALPCGRRDFIKTAIAVGAATAIPAVATTPAAANEIAPGPLSVAQRRLRAYTVRVQAAAAEYARPVPPHPNNGDEQRYPTRIGNYTKGLPHNSLGEVDPAAYQAYLAALASGDPADMERIPEGCSDSNWYKYVNPQAGLAYDLEGVDSHATYIPPAPAVASEEEAGEAIELYWMALARDIPFGEYDTNPLTVAAAADLSRLPDFRGPKVGGAVTTGTLFRDTFPGCLVGPYISQFRWMPVPFGALTVNQKMRTATPGIDYMTNYADWLAIQNGCLPDAQEQLEPVTRYMITGRDAAQFVHMDILHEAYYLAMLILAGPTRGDSEANGIAAPLNPGNPYLASRNQTGFATFGAPYIETVTLEVGSRALKAQWFQKWFVHRRVRPEEYAGHLHNYLTGAAPGYPLGTQSVRNTEVLGRIFSRYGTYLLPQAFPEGCPLHPSYGSGHATVAGACVTMLKAMFDESYVIANPVVPTADGAALEPWSGPPLTVGGELNKLASNVAQSRNIAGVHWRSDAVESLKLGEAVAISVLRDQRLTYNEDFRGFTFTMFDGTRITV